MMEIFFGSVLKQLIPLIVQILSLFLIVNLLAARYKLPFTTLLWLILFSYVPFVIATIGAMMLSFSFEHGFLPVVVLIPCFILQFAILFWRLREHYGNHLVAKMVGIYAVIAIITGIIL